VHVRITRKVVTLATAAALAATAATTGAAGATQSSDRPAVKPLPDGTTPVMGGHLNVSGEAEVGSPWTPAAIRCDSYCYARARTFFDQVAVLGTDGQYHPFLAESIEPNEDFSEWTITVREGITFTDGTPLDAAAMIYNLQAAGTGILVTTSLKPQGHRTRARPRGPGADAPQDRADRRHVVHDLHG
jgi:peptide/nickel transport system substrate-binding protein